VEDKKKGGIRELNLIDLGRVRILYVYGSEGCVVAVSGARPQVWAHLGRRIRTAAHCAPTRAVRCGSGGQDGPRPLQGEPFLGLSVRVQVRWCAWLDLLRSGWKEEQRLKCTKLGWMWKHMNQMFGCHKSEVKTTYNLVNKDYRQFVICGKIVMIFRVRLCVGVKKYL
jgi:hypothetical protein